METSPVSNGARPRSVSVSSFNERQIMDWDLIENEKQAEAFVDGLRQWDKSFDPDLPRTFPYYVASSQTESNGYPTVTYTTISENELSFGKDG